MLGCLVLNHLRALRLASRLLILSAILLAASLQFVSRHGVYDTAVLIYPSTIVAASALLDRRWFIPLTCFAMLAFAPQYGLDLSGAVTFRTGFFCVGEPSRRGLAWPPTCRRRVGEATPGAGGGSAKAWLDHKAQATASAARRGAGQLSVQPVVVGLLPDTLHAR